MSNIIHISKERESCEVDHEYEVLDKYNQAYEDVQVTQAPPPKQKQQQSSSAGDYELNQCPAYVPVTNSNCQTEISPTTASSAEVAADAGSKGQDESGTDDAQKMMEHMKLYIQVE